MKCFSQVNPVSSEGLFVDAGVLGGSTGDSQRCRRSHTHTPATPCDRHNDRQGFKCKLTCGGMLQGHVQRRGYGADAATPTLTPQLRPVTDTMTGKASNASTHVGACYRDMFRGGAMVQTQPHPHPHRSYALRQTQWQARLQMSAHMWGHVTGTCSEEGLWCRRSHTHTHTAATPCDRHNDRQGFKCQHTCGGMLQGHVQRRGYGAATPTPQLRPATDTMTGKASNASTHVGACYSTILY